MYNIYNIHGLGKTRLAASDDLSDWKTCSYKKEPWPVLALSDWHSFVKINAVPSSLCFCGMA